MNPADAVPIWRQIEEGVRRMIAAGALPAGEIVPSVRELARELRVNPATVSRAYQRLTEGGVLTVRRGEGTFVSENGPSMRKAERRQALREGASRYASLAITSGSNLGEAVRELQAAFRTLGGGPDEEAK